MNFFMVSFRCILLASAATRRRLRETIYHERKARRCMSYTKCSEVRGSGKGMDMRMIDKVHVLDSQLPGLRYLFPSNSDTDGLSSIFQDPKHCCGASHGWSATTAHGQSCSMKRRGRLKRGWVSRDSSPPATAILERYG